MRNQDDMYKTFNKPIWLTEVSAFALLRRRL